jgi:hypothetical protein
MGPGLVNRNTGIGQLSFGDDEGIAKSKNGKKSPRIRTTNPIVMRSQSDFYSPTTTSALAQSFNDETEDDIVHTEENPKQFNRKSKKQEPSQINTEEDDNGEKLFERILGITMHYVQETWSQDGKANKLQVC